MSEEGVQRKLTTILAADVVGYSHLMGEDEALTQFDQSARINPLQPDWVDVAMKVVHRRLFIRELDVRLVLPNSTTFSRSLG